MSTEGVSVAMSARAQRDARIARRREAERACAADFLLRGDLHGEHAQRCVRPAGLLCSRDYNPGPKPDDESLYEGTSLGALWGLNTLDSWQLAGWNIVRTRGAA